jgi:P-type Cu+ transporter
VILSAFSEEDIMKKDVVCGEQVDENTTTNSSDYNGKMFYFCSPACQTKFSQRPEVYANKEARIPQQMSGVYTPPLPDSKPR